MILMSWLDDHHRPCGPVEFDTEPQAEAKAEELLRQGAKSAVVWAIADRAWWVRLGVAT